MSFLVLPSALIQASGFATLTLNELRLFWRIVGMLSTDEAPDEDATDRVTLRILVSDLMEAGDKSRALLVDRLDALSDVKFKVNLDGRDGHELWRMSLRLVSEYELRNEWVEIDIGKRMYQAIRERTTFTRIREAALFSMRGSKYSSILYTLIRDKMNQRESRWEIEVPYFRQIMQLKEGSYKLFDAMRVRVIDPAVKEINDVSEFNLSWSKARTWKNQVRALAFEWSLKEKAAAKATAKELGRSKVARGKKQSSADAPPLIVDRAMNYLKAADFYERKRWADTAKNLGCPDYPAMEAPDNIWQWSSWVARMLVDEGLIAGA